MAWPSPGSAIFNAWVYDALYKTTSFAGVLSATTFKCALFNNAGTPDSTAVSNTAKYSSSWAGCAEQTDATNWVAGGRPLGTPTAPPASYSAQNFVMFDAPDTAGAGNVTLANVFGDMVYDDNLTSPVADQAIAMHYFGGTQGVTAGTFTVVWHGNGVARWTHAYA